MIQTTSTQRPNLSKNSHNNLGYKSIAQDFCNLHFKNERNCKLFSVSLNGDVNFHNHNCDALLDPHVLSLLLLLTEFKI